MEGKQQHRQRPPRASVPAFGGWEGGGGGGAAPPDYSLDFSKIRAARLQRRKALSWSSFVGAAAAANGAVVDEEAPGGDGDDGETHHQWSSSVASDGDDDDGERRRRHHRRLRRQRSDAVDDRQPIQPGRADPKGRGKFKGYLFGCVGGIW